MTRHDPIKLCRMHAPHKNWQACVLILPTNNAAPNVRATVITVHAAVACPGKAPIPNETKFTH